MAAESVSPPDCDECLPRSPQVFISVLDPNSKQCALKMLLNGQNCDELQQRLPTSAEPSKPRDVHPHRDRTLRKSRVSVE